MKTHFYALLFLFLLSLGYGSSTQAQDKVSNLPCFYITTENGVPVISRDDYIDGKLFVAGGSPDSGYYNGDIEIRGRGNGTWGFPKKPYRIKLASKYNLLGMPAEAKSWVLLANYGDKTLMRNALAFEVSKFFGFEYSPAYRMADVYLNGDYQGTYTITDQIEQGDNRVDIEDLDEDDTELPAITGGYLIQAGGQARSDSPYNYTTTRGMDYVIKYPDDPDDINPQQKSYINGYVQDFENGLYASNFKDPVNGYRKYADVQSLADWYLLNEICSNSDMFWSNYMFKHRDGKLTAGPMWDYDIAFDNDNRIGDTKYKYMLDKGWSSKVWINQLLNDETFYQTVKSRWFEVKKAGLVKRMLDVTDSLARVLYQSQKLNFQRWPILDEIVNQELAARGSYRNEVKFLKSFVNIHSAWLDSEFSGFDSTENYNITSQQSNKVWDVVNSSTAEGSGLVQFTLNGSKNSQKWKLVNLNNGYYKIVNASSGKVTSTDGSVNAESQLIQKTYAAGDATQQWRVINTGTHYGLINRSSLQAVDNFGSVTSDNNKITQFWEDIYNRENQFYSIDGSQAAAILKTTDVTGIQFNLSPNPVTGNNVRVGLHLTTDADVKVFIYNAQGLLIRQASKGKLLKGDTNFMLSTAGLRTGNYRVTVIVNNKKGSQLLLVK